MKQLFWGLLLFFPVSLFAQSDNDKPKRFGVSASYELLRSNIDAIYSTDSVSYLATATAFNGFNLGFQVFDKKGKNYHDISLSRFYYNIFYSSSRRGNNTLADSIAYTLDKPLNFQIGVKYAYFLRLTKKEGKSKFLLEFPIEVFYHRWVGYNESFYKSSNTIGLNIGFTPHYQYFFYKNSYLDIAVPLSIYNGLYSFSNFANPNIQLSDRKKFVAYHYSGTPIVNFRIGLGVKF